MDSDADDSDVHQAVMRAVLAKIGHDNLVLKGGAALIFGYGVKRHTNDLDFDAERPTRDLEKRIKTIDVGDVKIVGIDRLKNTDTVTRYRLNYETPEGSDSLKIEISYRQGIIDDEDVFIIDGLRFSSLARIIDQKLRAAFDGDRPRTRARDLYDLDAIAREHPEAFTSKTAERLLQFAADPSQIVSRYKPAFVEDDFDITDDDLEEMALRLSENAKQIQQNISVRDTKKAVGTSVRDLCTFAGIAEKSTEESSTTVSLVNGGGHRKVVGDGGTPEQLLVDMSLVPAMDDKKQRTVEVLRILANELGSPEAADSLSRAGISKTPGGVADGNEGRT